MTSPGPSLLSRLRRTLAILVVFVVAGPLIGTALFFFLVTMFAIRSSAELLIVFVAAIFAVYAAPAGYVSGLLPAAAAGLLLGIWQSFLGRVTWPFAAVIGVFVGTGFRILHGKSIHLSQGATDTTEYGPYLIASSLLATLACWWIVRKWHVGERFEVTTS